MGKTEQEGKEGVKILETRLIKTSKGTFLITRRRINRLIHEVELTNFHKTAIKRMPFFYSYLVTRTLCAVL